MTIKYIPRPVIKLVLQAARDIRDGAKTRTQMGGRVGDNAFADCIHECAQDLARDILETTNMRVSPGALRPLLWRAARVGEYRSAL